MSFIDYDGLSWPLGSFPLRSWPKRSWPGIGGIAPIVAVTKLLVSAVIDVAWGYAALVETEWPYIAIVDP